MQFIDIVLPKKNSDDHSFETHTLNEIQLFVLCKRMKSDSFYSFVAYSPIRIPVLGTQPKMDG